MGTLITIFSTFFDNFLVFFATLCHFFFFQFYVYFCLFPLFISFFYYVRFTLRNLNKHYAVLVNIPQTKNKEKVIC